MNDNLLIHIFLKPVYCLEKLSFCDVMSKSTCKELNMATEDQVKELPDKSTHDQSLSYEERSSLEEWYAFQDGIEQEALSLTMNDKKPVALPAQIEKLLIQLTIVTKHIHEITTENDSLKQE